MSDASSSSPQPPAPHGHDEHDPHAVNVPHDAEHFHAHTGLYLKVFAALTIGTIITVAVSFVHFGSEAANIAVGLVIATLKAALVVLFFMHMKEERPTIFQFMVPTMIMLFALFGLCLLGYYDHIHF